MKKKKVIILTIIILTIIFAVIVASKLISKTEDSETKLQAIYDSLNTNNAYALTIEQNDNNKRIMAKKDDKTVIDQYSEDSRITTLVKDDNTYLILHNKEEYYLYERNNIDQSILTEGLKDLLNKSYTIGTEKVKGKKYNYEEYAGSTVFVISNPLSLNEEEIKTRLYFNKKDELEYVKTIYGEESELLKINLTYEVDNSLFEIPSNYAEN